ncbi:MAG: efflux RND transporter periplasmic adaptor subunit [bacterium]
MKTKYWIITVIALLIIIVAVVIVVKKNKQPLLTFEKIKRGDITATVSATGQINPVVWAQVGAQISGQIIRLYADFNSIVKKGQLLALIDPTPFEAALAQAKANLLSAEAGVIQAKANMELDKANYERYLSLPPDLVSKQQLDTAKATYEVAAANFSAAQAAVLQAKANYKIAKFNLEHTRILSPLNGVVITRDVNPGQTVAASFQTPDLFVIAEDLTKMESDTNVVETDIGKVKVGQKAEFTVDAYPDTIFHGTVAIIRNAPMVIQNVVNYDVIIYVDNKDLKLKPGMTSYVTIDVGKQENILMIPNAALRFVPKNSDAIIRDYSLHHKLPDWVHVPNAEIEKREWYRITKVWKYKDGQFIPIPIQTGIRDNYYTQLINGDLKEGDEVVTGYQQAR